MDITLCLDFGNTRWKGALCKENKILETFVLGNDPQGELTGLLQEHQPRFSILSSVVRHPPEIETLLRDRTNFHSLSNASLLPFTIPVGKPESVGADRLAIAAATVDNYGGMNTLAIALGSCITYNFINSTRELIGGSISPGLEMRFKALQHYTAKLPLVQSDWNVPLIGWDTVTNIQSGVVLGMAFELDGIVSAYMERYGNFNALLTGGDIAVLAPHLKNKIFADPDLIFKGLYAISKINHA